MKTVLCIIGEELSAENEAAILQYDQEDILIHLYTNAIKEGISIGTILELFDQIEIAEVATNRYLMSDMPDYLTTAEALYSGLFGKFLYLPHMGRNYSTGDLIREETDKNKVLILSYLVEMLADQQDFQQMNYLVLNSNEFTLYNRYYYWRQTMRILLRKKNLKDTIQLEGLYQSIYQGYYDACKDLLKPVYKETRRRNLIYLITLQFIGLQHPPTRSALERISVLSKQLQKQVKVINTREPMTQLGKFPMFAATKASLNESLFGSKEYLYDGMQFTIEQSTLDMPEIGEVRKILQEIRTEKPYMILVMGNSSIVADMAAHIVPVINIPVVFSSTVARPGQYTAIGRRFSSTERQQLFHSDSVPTNIIESTFSFSLKEQINHYQRIDFHLPEERFLLLVVGTRLHDEVDVEFIDTIRPLLHEGAFLVFAGRFDGYEKRCEVDSDLKNLSTFVGFQDDIMAFDELMDLYVNPKRSGGGYSVIEAFSKGVPCITLRYGDIAAAAGDEFCVETYMEMRDSIRRYMNDSEFYQNQVKKAKRRVTEVTDAVGALQHIMKEAESRELFF
ncbi:MAG: glycosyltransferase [bacterium]|nr:glycosyltransferase [bacterium]